MSEYSPRPEEVDLSELRKANFELITAPLAILGDPKLTAPSLVLGPNVRIDEYDNGVLRVIELRQDEDVEEHRLATAVAIAIHVQPEFNGIDSQSDLLARPSTVVPAGATLFLPYNHAIRNRRIELFHINSRLGRIAIKDVLASEASLEIATGGYGAVEVLNTFLNGADITTSLGGVSIVNSGVAQDWNVHTTDGIVHTNNVAGDVNVSHRAPHVIHWSFPPDLQ